ncbi:hypothetical protein [Frankia gtarii]|uniref:hypothetical protein n=1 Tax=Frankia gtarii TaxID=2950102 RepID=UPI0021BFCDFD|nr:hypothetical protein [Frankia gtarii]
MGEDNGTRAARMRSGSGARYPTHRLWALIASILLTIGGIAVLAFSIAADSEYYGSNSTYNNDYSDPPHIPLVALSLFLMLPIGMIPTCLLGRDLHRHRRRALGRFTVSERREIDRIQAWRAELHQNWVYARGLLHHLATGHGMQELRTWGPVMRPDERVYLHIPAYYSRFYGADPVYVHTTGVFLGSAPFMAAGYALTALGNHSRRQAALAASIPQWREFTTATVLVTSERILCEVSGRWLSFFPHQAVAIYPDPADWSIVLDFGDIEPLRLSGLNGPTLAVAIAWIVYGHSALAEHPGLEPLRR